MRRTVGLETNIMSSSNVVGLTFCCRVGTLIVTGCLGRVSSQVRAMQVVAVVAQ